MAHERQFVAENQVGERLGKAPLVQAEPRRGIEVGKSTRAAIEHPQVGRALGRTVSPQLPQGTLQATPNSLSFAEPSSAATTEHAQVDEAAERAPRAALSLFEF